MPATYTNLVILAISPIIIGLFYIYIRDKYEKEPKQLLIKGIISGILITLPIIYVQNYVMLLKENLILIDIFLTFSDINFYNIFYDSFITASLIEEFFKFLALYILIWRNKNFNEPLDAIVYSVFVSLGFSALENILYVLNPVLGGISTGIARGIFSVPAHGLFGVIMGYYLGLAKFNIANFKISFLKSLAIPVLVHGLYDLILLTENKNWFIYFILLTFILWITSLRKIKKFLEISPFKKTVEKKRN